MESWSSKTPKQSLGRAQMIKPGFSVCLRSFSLCVLLGQDGDHSLLLVDGKLRHASSTRARVPAEPRAGKPTQHDSGPRAGKSHPDPVLSSAQPGRGSFGTEGHGDLPVPVAQCTRCGPHPVLTRTSAEGTGTQAQPSKTWCMSTVPLSASPFALPSSDHGLHVPKTVGPRMCSTPSVSTTTPKP